ncbi:hypothetical protein [Holdemania massiliensis]|uniref:hypothetical protein n=1 Tax=Holdemania massiliensis TaxID=1468449 RepID=UPI001F057751|nr:hypothetical protein [Holdemania massiliensis]MCH1942437.1 hypothetical protein [Holdemania massiliensis]
MRLLFPFVLLATVLILFAMWVLPILNWKDFKIVAKLRRYSYWGLDYSKYGTTYSLQKYSQQALIVGFLSFALCYSSLDSMVYSLIITVCILFMLPYFIFLNSVRVYNDHLQEQIISYIQYAILFLKENRQVVSLLKDCAEIAEEPLAGDLKLLLKDIYENADLRLALKHFEKKYPQEEIKKLDNLLISKSLDGVYNLKQYDLTYSAIEMYQVTLSNYQIGREAKRKGFYMIVVLSIFVSYMVHAMFTVDMGANVTKVKFYYFLFYIFHVVLVLFYEHWSTLKNTFK